jgi:predicted nucleic acid-binding protein
VAENELAPPIVVCDAGPLIHLDEVGSMELLADFPQVLVPLAVWEEVTKHRPTLHVRASLLEDIIREVEQSH